MMKISVLLLMGITYYVAGSYRNLPLMVLFFVEAALFVAMLLLSLYLKRHLSIKIPLEKDMTEKDANYPCQVISKNTAKLPINRFVLQFGFRYRTNGNISKGRKELLKGKITVCGKKQTINKKVKLYGACSVGETPSCFDICPHYCGLLKIEFPWVKAFDYLALFGGKRKLKEQLTIAVCPKERPISIEPPSGGFKNGGAILDNTMQRKGTAQEELMQLREYVYGDQNRHIHWNQSARADELYVKEFHKETDACVEIYLDYTDFSNDSICQKDGFYEIVSSLVAGLLRERVICQIGWYDESVRSIYRVAVSSYEQWKQILAKLFEKTFTENTLIAQKEELEKRWTELRALKSDYFKINQQLELYYNDTLLHQFTTANLYNDLKLKKFYL